MSAGFVYASIAKNNVTHFQVGDHHYKSEGERSKTKQSTILKNSNFNANRV